VGLRFDILAQQQAVSLVNMAALGFSAKNFWNLLNPNEYDYPQMAIMVQAGVTGARRAEGNRKPMTTDEAMTLMQDHIDWVNDQLTGIESEDEAVAKFGQMRIDLAQAIGKAAEAGVGFRRGAKAKEDPGGK